MSMFRTEKDSLGDVKIPAKALYGAQTARALANYQISGRTAAPELIRAYLKIKQVAADANFKLKVLDQNRARLIQRSCKVLLELPDSAYPHLFPIDAYQAGAGTSQNMNLNEVIANFANRLIKKPFGSYSPVHPNDHVNCSQSTNDTFPTAMRLALLESSRQLEVETHLLAQALEKKSSLWKSVNKSARTHLQDAVPMTLGQEFSGYAKTIDRCSEWIHAGRAELRVLGIGGTAAGTGLNAPKGYPKLMVAGLQTLCKEKLVVSANLFDSMQSQAPVLFYGSMLRLLAVELTRICNDLRLLASGPLTGLAEIELPAVQPGSSIMPGKINPSIIEMCNQTFYSVIGYEQTAMMVCQAGQLELNVMMPMMAYSLLEATKVAGEAIKTLRERAIEGIKPNTKRLQRYFEMTPQAATALSPKLGYDVTAKLVKEALEKEISVFDLARQKHLL